MNETHNDLRLIEDYLPIEAISAEASREKSVRKGHISTLHLWWARRPLVACRAAVYGALVPADRWVKEVKLKNPPEDPEKAERVRNGKKLGLNRKAAAEFVTRLCKYPGDPRVIADAQKHILEAHAERLTAELADGREEGRMPAWVEEFKFTGERVSYDDIVAGRAPRPRVLDMFAGGGAIPLEALRLGCEAYALDLNPVAHIIELCTLVYPQKYGKPDPTAYGMTGAKNTHGNPTWGGLAEEVRYWGMWVIERVRKEIGDLYPLIPDPDCNDIASKAKSVAKQSKFYDDERPADGDTPSVDMPPGYLMPIAYLWTRTVRCKNPTCGATVPLVRQTWLCKKPKRFVALRPIPNEKEKRLTFEVVDVSNEKSLGFDPSAFSKGGNATCPFCGTVSDLEYVKGEGRSGRLGDQLVGAVAGKRGSRGWVYLAGDWLERYAVPQPASVQSKLETLAGEHSLTPPSENIAGLKTNDNSLGIRVRPYGITQFADLFSPRQQIFHLRIALAMREMQNELKRLCISQDHAKALVTMLACVADRATDFGCKLCVWNPYKDSGTTHAFGRQTITMIWDYSEVNPLNSGNAGWALGLDRVVAALESAPDGHPANVQRGSATNLPYDPQTLDAVITDPPYYDNVPYADISDFFYVWLKRSVGYLYPEHFSSSNTPKKTEAIADANRHGGDWDLAKAAYERMMAESFSEACRTLKNNGQLAIVYAHKTTLGWAALVDALRRAGFSVTEAWPLDTEFAGRLRGHESAALASSIFLIARKRPSHAGIGNYDDDVQPELERTVRERVETLWDQGISGADLVIACVGAGLRAFTRFSRVEYANGEEVPAERFLAEVETVVLDSILGRLSKEVGGNGGRTSLAGVDPATRFYVLWRYTYKAADLDAGEAIVFANGTHVELDGPEGLTAGSDAVLEKKKGKYRLRDFTERGDDEDLGMPFDDGQPAPIIDALHRTLWLMENRPSELPVFLREAQPNREQMRLVAQALAGPGLKGGELADVSPSSEQAALAKLTANWRSVVEDAVTTTAERADQKRGQRRMFEGR